MHPPGWKNSMSHISSPHKTRIRLAHHMCDHQGRWRALNTSDCPFVSDTTKILEQFAATNISSSKTTSLLDYSRSLRNFTQGGLVFKDPIDLVFLAQTVQQYTTLLPSLPAPRETAEVLFDVVASTLSASRG